MLRALCDLMLSLALLCPARFCSPCCCPSNNLCLLALVFCNTRGVRELMQVVTCMAQKHKFFTGNLDSINHDKQRHNTVCFPTSLPTSTNNPQLLIWYKMHTPIQRQSVARPKNLSQETRSKNQGTQAVRQGVAIVASLDKSRHTTSESIMHAIAAMPSQALSNTS